MTRYEIKQLVPLANYRKEWIKIDVHEKESVAWNHFDNLIKSNPGTEFALIRVDEEVIGLYGAK